MALRTRKNIGGLANLQTDEWQINDDEKEPVVDTAQQLVTACEAV